jgi:hypothetical protein
MVRKMTGILPTVSTEVTKRKAPPVRQGKNDQAWVSKTNLPFHFDLYAMTIFCSGVKTLFPPVPPLGAAETAALVAAAAAAEAIMEAVLNEVRAVPAATSVVGKPKLVGRMRDAAVSLAMLAVLTAVMIPGADMFSLLLSYDAWPQKTIRWCMCLQVEVTKRRVRKYVR